MPNFIVDTFLVQQFTQKRNVVMGVIAVAVVSFMYEWVSSKFLAFIGLVYVAYHISDLTTKYIFNKLPRQLIDNINEKAVLISGCDSGFGHHLATKLDGMGFKVYAGCLNVRSEGAQQLKRNCSNSMILVPLDVTKSDQIHAAKQLVSSTLDNRKLWAVVNNAGVACSSEIEWCPIETFQRMLDVNTLGAVRLTKAFLPKLRESHGRVVIVASMAGRVTVPGFTPYSMSKFAVVAFADGLRREMKKWAISVHLIEPSLYKTNIAVLEPLYQSLTNYWNECPEDVLSSYGPEYLLQYKAGLEAHMMRAKPESKIVEVVDDMADAVAGAEPLLRYVPAMDVQFRSRLLMGLPVEVQDHVLNQYSPKTPPAAVAAKKGLPPLKSPYEGTENRSRSPLQRHLSVPVREKNRPETLQEEDDDNDVKNAFSFE